MNNSARFEAMKMDALRKYARAQGVTKVNTYNKQTLVALLAHQVTLTTETQTNMYKITAEDDINSFLAKANFALDEQRSLEEAAHQRDELGTDLQDHPLHNGTLTEDEVMGSEPPAPVTDPEEFPAWPTADEVHGVTPGVTDSKPFEKATTYLEDNRLGPNPTQEQLEDLTMKDCNEQADPCIPLEVVDAQKRAQFWYDNTMNRRDTNKDATRVLQRIARHLNDEKVPTVTKAKYWTAKEVAALLS